ncbi:uncharacterized protein [Elaeis guineensis]|uniref:uncharacterized protein isoform X2 n=1 Tax=Elaeis guineensis var. tenera TaxID=51953 RepID=UPI003C6D727D
MFSSKSCPILSCHYPCLPSLHPPQKLFHRTHSILKPKTLNPGTGLSLSHPFSSVGRRALLQICRDSNESKNFGGSFLVEKEIAVERSGDGDGSANNWTTSILLFGLWAGLMYYVFQLAPNQTPAGDVYYLQKLLNLKGDDGFQMNEVLVALWYFMGLWPFIYSMLLVPTGRSSTSKIPVWPFLVVSFFGGAYALIPYFVLWKPPPPAVGEDEISRWPLNFLDSKITAGILLVAGLGLTMYAGLANSDVWKEFYRYFRESKFLFYRTASNTLQKLFEAGNFFP